LLEDIDTSEAIRLALESQPGLEVKTVSALSSASPTILTKPAEVAFVLGGPGAGKGTQCAKIVEEFGWVHLSAGDLLRAERATGSENAQLINNYITEGKIVPVEITIKLILAAMEKQPGKKFLIDGFPRSEDNKEGWYKIAAGRAEVKFCLFYDCSMEEMEKRLLERGKTSGRADDNLESIKKRFVTFQETSMPVVSWFRDQGLLREISSARSVEEVWADTSKLFEEPTNTAFVFIKPHAVNDSVQDLVKQHFLAHEIEIVRQGSMTSEHISKHGLIDSHYAALAENAVKVTPGDLGVAAGTKLMFEAQFGCAWDKALEEGKLMNLAGFQDQFPDMSVEAIENKWRAGKALKLAPGTYVGHMKDEDVFVVNAFYGQMRQKYIQPGASMVWFVVKFSEATLSWQRFRGNIIGATDPTKAGSGSLRGKILANWKELGLTTVPNMGDNGVHASAGPVEGLKERMVWLSNTMETDPAGRAMIKAGVSPALLEAWCSNSVCEIAGKKDKAFDLLEDIDTSEAIRLALESQAKLAVVVFVLGGPGAGKGTQCAKIVEEFGWVHLSAGDLLRAERATDSENAQLINNYITEGKLVPVEITLTLILAAMDKQPGKKFLIDGFPRSQDNKAGWDKMAAGKVDVKFCLFYDCPMEELEKRLLERGKTSGRADDNLESIKKRFNTFQESSMPIVTGFKEQGLLREIFSARAVEDVWADTQKLFQDI
jgi:UMP-CMP kinase